MMHGPKNVQEICSSNLVIKGTVRFMTCIQQICCSYLSQDTVCTEKCFFVFLSHSGKIQVLENFIKLGKDSSLSDFRTFILVSCAMFRRCMNLDITGIATTSTSTCTTIGRNSSYCSQFRAILKLLAALSGMQNCASRMTSFGAATVLKFVMFLLSRLTRVTLTFLSTEFLSYAHSPYVSHWAHRED